MYLLESIRRWGMTFFDYLDQRRKQWINEHPLLVKWMKKIYTVLAWLLLGLAVLSWIFFPETRKALVQFLWSYYALWQFWFLSRSKTLAWTHYARFFVIGAWVCGPLAALIVWLTHSVLGDASSTILDNWSQEVFGPVVEEVVKILPLLFFILFSRRVQSFSTTDYMLVGAASGAGFEFIEEVVRRWVTGQQDHSLLGAFFNLFDTSEIVWEVDTIFPGYTVSGDVLAPGHHVWTAFVALAIGLAVRFRKKWGRKAYGLPVLVLLWAIFDHGAFNSHFDGLPSGVEILYLFTGFGHFYKWAFVAFLILAIILDYRAINRVPSLPHLPGEKVIEPVSELVSIIQSMPRGRQMWSHSMIFFRERRQMAFSILRKAESGQWQPLADSLSRRSMILAGVFASLLLFCLALSNNDLVTQGMHQVYFAGLLDSLSEWWQGLSGWEKVGIIVTTAVIGGLLTFATGGGFLAGGFTALASALTAQDILENPAPAKSFLEDPVGQLKQWGRQLMKLPPQEAGAVVLAVAADQMLRRTPVVKVVDELADRVKSRAQHFARKWIPGGQVQEAGTGMRVDWNEPDVRETRGAGGSGGDSGQDPEPKKKEKAWERFEKEDPLPGSVGVEKTNSLFKQVQNLAYKENPDLRKTFGIPDDMVVNDGRITIVEEAKMYSKKDFEQLGELAKDNPRKFITEGIQASSDQRQKRFIQLIKHKRSVNYLLSNLEKVDMAKELGITRTDSKITYMLKVPKHAPDEALEAMKKAFEEKLKIQVNYRKIDW
jgi:RsiW-degrading membrane proteinase PrsW (M82 family)